MEIDQLLKKRDFKAVWISDSSYDEYKQAILGLQRAMLPRIVGEEKSSEMYFEALNLYLNVEVIQATKEPEYFLRVGQPGQEPSLVLQIPTNESKIDKDYVLGVSEISPKVFREIATLIEQS